MRIRHAIACMAAVLISASAVSDEPIVALAIEPEIAAPETPTLESAARANDFTTFDALYRAEPDPAYRTLHELWTYSMTERTGAFYGAEMYERLSREYPAYAEFIDAYKVVDAHGEAYYPSSETRAFLLDHRTPAPRVIMRKARVEPAEPAAVLTAAPRPRETVVAQKPAPQPAPPPAAEIALASAPAAMVVEPAPVADLALASTPIVAASTPAVAPAAVPPVVPSMVSPPVVQAAAVPAPAAATPEKPTNRGLLLVIIGIVGIGLLALIVRAPREVIP